METLEQRVCAEVAKEGLIPRNGRLLVAVSGGVDSMVLLRILASASAGRGWKLQVAHFNHELRGAASRADERLVVATCRELGLECHVGRGAVRKAARDGGVSIEMAARELRYRFLAETAGNVGINVVALAHHAGDQAETFFLKLLRGAGGDGLGGMRLKSPSPVSRKLTLIRPMLAESKQAILEYARRNTVSFRDDATNADDSMLRNRIRSKLLPVLRKEFGESSVASVVQSMAILRDESDFAREMAEEWLSAGKPKTAFEKLHVSVQRQVIRLQLIQAGLEPGFDMTERLREVPNQRMSVGRQFVLREAGSGMLRVTSSVTREFNIGKVIVEIGSGGGVDFDGLSLKWSLKPARKPFTKPGAACGKELFDAKSVGHRVLLRHWRPGDRFQPIGLPGPVKLQDLFVNARIDVRIRRSAVIASTGDGRIFWVEGLRIGEAFKVGRETVRRLEWHWKRA